jgi:hypothetical protein
MNVPAVIAAATSRRRFAGLIGLFVVVGAPPEPWLKSRQPRAAFAFGAMNNVIVMAMRSIHRTDFTAGDEWEQ